MPTKVKGLLKGLRYISQIFDEKEEDEIQIGFPTDVKHVAHIGMDGPTSSNTNTPSWMTDFKAADPSSGPETGKDNNTKNTDNSTRGIPKARHHSSIENQTNCLSPGTDGAKQGRRHRSSDPSSDSTVRDSSTVTSRSARKQRSSNNQEAQSPTHEGSGAAPPKQSRRRKTKTGSEDGSTRSSRRSSKGDSLTDISLADIGSESEPLESKRSED